MATPRRGGHKWFFDTYVAGYHHGHWVEGTAYLAGALRRFHHQVRPRTGMPPVDAVLLPKDREYMTEIEQVFYAAATQPYNLTEPIL